MRPELGIDRRVHILGSIDEVRRSIVLSVPRTYP